MTKLRYAAAAFLLFVFAGFGCSKKENPAPASMTLPAEDRLEPAPMESARLPGGGTLNAEPAPVASTNRKPSK